MKIFTYTAAIFLIATLISCSTGDVKKVELQGEEYKSLAAQKYGQGVDFVRNASGTAMLCVKKSKPTQLEPQQQIAFLVYDMITQSLLFEDTMPNGSVSWMDDVSVIVNRIPGTVKDEDKIPAARAGYIYDLRSRKIRDLDSVNVR